VEQVGPVIVGGGAAGLPAAVIAARIAVVAAVNLLRADRGDQVIRAPGPVVQDHREHHADANDCCQRDLEHGFPVAPDGDQPQAEHRRQEHRLEAGNGQRAEAKPVEDRAGPVARRAPQPQDPEQGQRQQNGRLGRDHEVRVVERADRVNGEQHPGQDCGVATAQRQPRHGDEQPAVNRRQRRHQDAQRPKIVGAHQRARPDHEVGHPGLVPERVGRKGAVAEALDVAVIRALVRAGGQWRERAVVRFVRPVDDDHQAEGKRQRDDRQRDDPIAAREGEIGRPVAIAHHSTCIQLSQTPSAACPPGPASTGSRRSG